MEAVQTRTRSSRWRRARRVALLIVGMLAIWLVIAGWLAWSLRSQLLSLEIFVRTQPRTLASMQQTCERVQTAGQTGRRLRTVVLPASPLLRHLGWLPKIGALLEATPALLDVSVRAADTSDLVCSAFVPAFAVFDVPKNERITTLLESFNDTPPPWAELRGDIASLHAAWQAIPPDLWQHSLFAPYAKSAQRLSHVLSKSQPVLELVEALWPALPTLLGTADPTTLIVLGQNPLELRATGGFIGSLGTVTLDQGRVTALEYRDSADFDVIAPAGSDFPLAYSSYLRASQWYLRDANWWPDFARSAGTIEAFWELNEQPPVDGVVAVDLYALQGVIQAIGPVDVPGYGVITATDSLESVFNYYEPSEGEGSTDKIFLKRLFEATLQKMQQADPDGLIALMVAIKHAFDERHISIQLHDSVAQAAFAARHWDGEVRQTDAGYLQIVDAELSYSDVQGLIDQRVSLDILHDLAGHPLTHTLTITYSNRYDGWRAGQTRHWFHGFCYNPEVQRNERIPGCSGNYVRLYLPQKTIPVALAGSDTPFDVELDTNKLVIGYYMLLLPGQTRTISFTYQPLLDMQNQRYDLLVQKQAGTIANPLVINLRQPGRSPVVIQSDLWRDREFRLSADTQGVRLLDPLEPLHPQNIPAYLAQPADWLRGWRLWEAGSKQQAVELWRSTGTLDYALDQVVGLRSSGSQQAAEELWQALDAANPQTSRLLFLGAELARERGDFAGAEADYQQILKTNPDNDATRFQLATLALDRGDRAAALAELRAMRDPLAALRRKEKLELYQQDYPAAIDTNRLMVESLPQNPLAWNRLYGLQAAYIQPTDWQALNVLANQALTQFPDSELWLWRRAETYASLQQPELALADIQRVTKISPTNHLAWYQQGLLSDKLGDLDGAVAALEQAAKLDPAKVAYQLFLASYYQRQGRIDLARESYQRAATLDPTNTSIQDQLAALEAP